MTASCLPQPARLRADACTRRRCLPRTGSGPRCGAGISRPGFLSFRLRGVDPEQAARSNAQVAVQAGLGGDDAAQLGVLVGAELVITSSSWAIIRAVLAASGSASGLKQSDEPLILGEPHFLDLEGSRRVLGASLPGHRGFDGREQAVKALANDDMIQAPSCGTARYCATPQDRRAMQVQTFSTCLSAPVRWPRFPRRRPRLAR
jgi:hypothetical protein